MHISYKKEEKKIRENNNTALVHDYVIRCQERKIIVISTVQTLKLI